jgi:hypothetical protein
MVVRGRRRLIERRKQDLEVVEAVVLVDADAGGLLDQRGRDPG